MSAFDWGMVIGNVCGACVLLVLHYCGQRRFNQRMDEAERRAFGDPMPTRKRGGVTAPDQGG